MSNGKTCARCRATKPLSEFAPGKKWSDGLYPYCRDCKRAKDRAYHARNKAARNSAGRAQYARNPQPYKDRATAAYTADPDTVKQRASVWRKANPERRKQIASRSAKRRHELSPERRREVWRRRHAAVKRGVAVYQFTAADVALKVAYWGSACWVCRGPYQAIDHVKPLRKGGPHMLANLRPVCTSCNTRKLDRWPLP